MRLKRTASRTKNLGSAGNAKQRKRDVYYGFSLQMRRSSRHDIFVSAPDGSSR